MCRDLWQPGLIWRRASRKESTPTLTSQRPAAGLVQQSQTHCLLQLGRSHLPVRTEIAGQSHQPLLILKASAWNRHKTYQRRGDSPCRLLHRDQWVASHNGTRCNSITWTSKEGGPQIPDQPGLPSEIPSQNQTVQLRLFHCPSWPGKEYLAG